MKQNLATLKAAVAAFHGVEVTDLNQGPVDMFLVTANNARKKAEKNHDFEYSGLTAVLSIDGVNGGSLSAAVITPADTFQAIKTISSVGAATAAGYIVPLDFMRASVAIEEDRAEEDASSPWCRYPSDAEVENQGGRAMIVQRGNSLYRFPRTIGSDSEGATVYIEGTGWLKDYTDDDLKDEDADPQDFLVEHGFEWLMWSAIIALNYKFQTFVPRQEGNVGSPKDERDNAWADLVRWDSYLVDPSSTRG